MSDLHFNPMDPEFVADPYPMYHRLRAEDPVHHSQLGFWILTRYEDVASVLRDPNFAKEAIAAFVAQRLGVDATIGIGISMLDRDPPDHTRLRSLVSKAFTPRVVEGLRPRIQQIVDELYVAFTGQSVVPGALERPNVVALRSLSKTEGLAALRLGFAVGHPTIVDRLRRVTGPYDVNMFAVVAGKAALADPDHVRRYVAEVLAAKAWTERELDRLGVRRSAGAGNYLLVWPPGDCDTVVAAIRTRGILVRSMARKPVIAGSFRLTIGRREDMQRFMTAFAQAIGREE